MQNPKVTILTASYNYEECIKETIESVLNQTYSNWELIIADDGSSDNSVNVIKSYTEKDSRIKLITHPNNENKGLIQTVKLLIDSANTDWIAFLESDDTIAPCYLEKKVDVINKTDDVKFIFNDIKPFGDKSRIDSMEFYFDKQRKALEEFSYPANIFKCFKKRNIIPTFSCVMAKKELFSNLDFRCPVSIVIDYYLWLQIAKTTPIYYLDEKLTNWRLHGSYVKTYQKAPYTEALFEYWKNLMFMNKFQKMFRVFYALYLCISVFRKMILRVHSKERAIYIFGRRFCY